MSRQWQEYNSTQPDPKDVKKAVVFIFLISHFRFSRNSVTFAFTGRNPKSWPPFSGFLPWLFSRCFNPLAAAEHSIAKTPLNRTLAASKLIMFRARARKTPAGRRNLRPCAMLRLRRAQRRNRWMTPPRTGPFAAREVSFADALNAPVKAKEAQRRKGPKEHHFSGLWQ